MEKVRCLILGSGPAGYTAAIYASRAGLSPVLYEGPERGGQLTTTTVVENYPGFAAGVDALSLMEAMREQAASFGADIRRGSAVSADLSSRPFHIAADDGKELEAETLIKLPALPPGISDFLRSRISRAGECRHALHVTAFSTGEGMWRSLAAEIPHAKRPCILPAFAARCI